MDLVLRIVAIVVGVLVVQAVLRSAVRTVVVPRAEQVLLARVVFLGMRVFYVAASRRKDDPDERAQVLARFAPMSLIALAASWVGLTFLGFIPIFWGASDLTFKQAMLLSGSSITTLGFAAAPSTIDAVLAFVEAFIGLGLLALLIAYLPTMYSHFSRREADVVKLEVRAGSPPSTFEMLVRVQRIGGYDRLHSLWVDWEQWFVELEESHTSQPSLALFRSQHGTNSWITAAGTVLDGAAVTLSSVEVEWDAQAALCLRSGFLALRAIAAFFNVDFDAQPAPNDPISVKRAEFDEMLAALAAEGVPIKADREQAWRDFAGWRVNYDHVLLALCAIVRAPAATWSSDRMDRFHPPTVWRPRRWVIDDHDYVPSW